MKNSIVFMFVILLFSCGGHQPIDVVAFEDPCLNGGEYSCGNFACRCKCPEGVCGKYCELEPVTTVYGNYEGIMVCQGDSITTQFKVEEYECGNRWLCRYRLMFNDGEFSADYWKCWENSPSENVPNDYGEFTIKFKDNEFYNPVNGSITPDSLSFWILEYENSLDTCFYVGVRE